MGTVTRLVLMVAWAMMGTLLRRVRRGQGGIGGSDEGEGLDLRSVYDLRRFEVCGVYTGCEMHLTVFSRVILRVHPHVD